MAEADSTDSPVSS